MKYFNQELIEEFYEREKHKYPGVSFEKFKESIIGSWKYLKNQMEGRDYPTIRLKYFGTFTVFPGKAKAMLEETDKRFAAGGITEEEHREYKEALNNYIKNTDESEN